MKTKKDNSKQQIAYDFIRQGIMEGTLFPGQRLVIDQLAKELSSSPIPVREAIHRLEAEGLVKIKPYSGAVVSSMNENEYVDILSTLAVLDGYAASLSLPRFPRDQIAKLHEYNEQMKQKLGDFDFYSFINLNREFHIFYNSFCGNQYLISQLELLWEKLDAIRRMSMKYFSTRAHEVIKEHEMMIAYLESSDTAEDIELFVRSHHINAMPRDL
ncbi:hypothetical protein SD71_20695 [Cohnella kolymensis]|uniref:HTH gntR-type domain-containing protein n=2 Tax=Cohnella kolymensis TaxID=1590652 RepID=A0ABR5A051_9BACL|nr:hypothetical protein SD71_20695 [Cohnella kolymensis]